MNITKNNRKLKFNGHLVMGQDKNSNLNSFHRYQYQINEMTEMRNKNLENNSIYKSFENDIKIINSTNQDLVNDIKNGEKNLQILVQKLINIQSEGNKELTNIAEEISEKIKDLYKFLNNTINNQNEENFRLKMELNKALKENDNLREQVQFLAYEVLKLEEINKENN